MVKESMSLLLVFMSSVALELDEGIMCTEAPLTSGDDLGITGGSPRNDPRIDGVLNWPGPYSWYYVSVSEYVST